jgi:trehalose 6-phosphate synthase
VRKSNSVTWIKGLLGPGCRLLVVGDDITDEDMFCASAEEDATVLVGSEPSRPTAARWSLASYAEVRAFSRWIISTRGGLHSPIEPRRPSRVETLNDAVSGGALFDLLVLSNRLPDLRSASDTTPARKVNVGGLVSGLAPVLAARKGMWLGWSGRTRADATATEVGLDQVDGVALAWVDFPEEWHRHYYNGMSNGALWPLFHSFPGRVHFSHEDWRCYELANEALATIAGKLVRPDATVWAHDYHLLVVGNFLRDRGHRGPIGFFQHIPFPGPDIFFLLPWADAVLQAMLAFDVVGFHTTGYVDNFLRCMARSPGARLEGDVVIGGDRR